MSLRNSLRQIGAHSSKTVYSKRDTETGENIRSVDLTDYIQGDGSHTMDDVVEGIAAVEKVELSTEAGSEDGTLQDTFEGRDIAAAMVNLSDGPEPAQAILSTPVSEFRIAGIQKREQGRKDALATRDLFMVMGSTVDSVTSESVAIETEAVSA